MFTGRLVGIYTTTEAAAPLAPSTELRAIEGIGLEGDRYATQIGTYSGRVGAGSILNTIVEDLSTPTNPSPGKHSSWFDFRLLVGVILLVPAIWFSWKTIDGLAARRALRTDLAEQNNVAAQYPDKVRDLLAQLNQIRSTGRSRP